MSLYASGLIWICVTPWIGVLAFILAVVNKKEDKQIMGDE